MKTTLTPVQKLCFAAMLMALAIGTTFLAKTVGMGNFYLIRFSLTPSLVVYTSLVLGPFYGMIVGMASDFIPAMILPTGDYNFLLTLVYGLLGVLPWAIEKISRHFRTTLKKPYVFYAALGGILAVVAAFYYGTDWLDSSFGATASWAKPTILVLTFLLDVGLCIALYLWNGHYEKKILENLDIPSPNEIAFISLISEVVVMDLAKALGFWSFYSFLSNGTFVIPFGFAFSMLFMVSSLEIMIMTFAVSWMLYFTKQYIHPLMEQNR